MQQQYEPVNTASKTFKKHGSELTINSSVGSKKTTDFTPTTPATRKFIRLFGTPEAHARIHHSNPSETPSTDEPELVDVLDATNEDPFSLESLDKLIQLHDERGKDFLLARVKTADTNDEHKFYYSYYAAHHINKVLFRTQPSEGLLHRMRAKNPLNNMTIVGDVHFYIIKATKLPRSSGESIRSVSSNLSASPTLRELEQWPKSPTQRPASPVDSSSHTQFKKIMARIVGSSHPKRTLHLVMKPEAFEASASGTIPLQQLRRKSLDSSVEESFEEIDETLSHFEHNAIITNQTRRPKSAAFANQSTTTNVADWIHARLESPALPPSTNTNSSKNHRKRSVKNGSKRQKDLERMSPSSASPLSPTFYYTANYYGTDDDFLMKASVRAHFKEMALEDGDAVLFTLPDESLENSQLMPHPSLPNFLYAMQENDGSTEWDSLSSSASKRTLKILLLSYVAFGVILVRFVVPEAYIYIVSFVLLFSCCLGLLLFL